MTAELRHIRGACIRSKRGVNESAMETIGRVARMVESGEVVGVSIALQYADGSAGRTTGGFRQAWPTIGALEEMKYDILNGDKDG